MLTQLPRRTWLAALILAVAALPILAAPAPKPEAGLGIDKYLLDDVDAVLVVNVKDILASPACKKGFAKQLADLVARPEAQEYLKDAGFDPLKDVERVIVCNSKTCWRDRDAAAPKAVDRDDGPFFLFQGKFDSAKLKAKMAAVAKDKADKVTSIDAPGGHKIYHIDPNGAGPYAAILDSRTVVVAGKKAHVLEALVKAGGKKATTLVHKEAAALLKKFKADAPVQGFALESFVMATTYTQDANVKGKGAFKRVDITLADKGFSTATLNVTIKDDARGSVVFNVRDKDKAKKAGVEFTTGLEEIRREFRQMAQRQPDFAAMIRFFEGVTIKSTDKTVTMEGKADSDMVQAMIASMFREIRP